MNDKIGLYTIDGKEDVYMETFTGKYVTPLKLEYAGLMELANSFTQWHNTQFL